MRELFAVGFGGFIGAITRYLLSGWVQAVTAKHPIPYGTLVVNVLGSAILGFLFYFSQSRSFPATPIREFVLIGLLGAFTTFSTFSQETVDLLLSGNRFLGTDNIFANVGLCVIVLLGTRILGQSIWG